MAAAIAACTLVVDTDGLSGGPTAEDGGKDVTAAPSDAMSDATDALPVDGGGAKGCAREAHEFCDDFDDGGLGVTWSMLTVSGNPSVTLTDAASVSSPNGLEVNVSAITDGGVRRVAYLTKSIVGSVKGVEVTFDVRADVLTGGGVNYATLSFDPAAGESSSYYSVGLAGAQKSATLYEYKEYPDGGYIEHDHAMSLLPLQKWLHMRFVLTIASPASYQLFVDGVSAAQGPLTPPTHTGISLYIGAAYINEPSGPTRVVIDNVTLDRLR